MNGTFTSSSRLANFRERKKSSQVPQCLNENGQVKLTLPHDDKISYEPSNSLNTTKTSLKLFKSKLQRVMSRQKDDIQIVKQQFKSSATVDTEPGTNNRISLHQEKSDMKLVLHDSPVKNDRKSLHDSEKKPQRRIMIMRQQTKQNKQEPIRQVSQIQTQAQAKQQQTIQQNTKQIVKQQTKQYKNPHDQKPIIKQQDIQESKDALQVQTQNQNDLVMCTQGCGRKFNRKALQKHIKACKLVFMSKRKQFNSQAKRVLSKQQANIAKQKNKDKYQLNKTKSKGFEKTSDNWKMASQDFRAAIKAVRKQQNCDNEQGIAKNEGNSQDKENQGTLNLISCQYCEKMFANMLIEKHVENCTKKKEKEKELEKKKLGAQKRKV